MASLTEIAQKARLSLAPAPSGTARSLGLRLRDSVLGPFAAWTTQFEGYTPFMYTDSKGLVTTGIGNEIDSVEEALALPWKVNGRLATPAEVSQAWNTVKQAWPGTQSYASQSLTNLRLDADGIRTLVNRTLKANDAALARAYPGYPNWPADGQLAANSMAWAMGVGRIVPGPAFQFMQLRDALLKNPPDFRAAAAASHMDDRGNAGLTPRNEANQLLFENAARVLEGAGHPNVLYYLRDVGGAIVRSGSTKKREIVTVVALVLGGAALLLSTGGSRR